MKLFKNQNKSIVFEAFHIFKVFVANPKKSRDVSIILYKNQEKLTKFLNNFLKDKGIYVHVTLYVCFRNVCRIVLMIVLLDSMYHRFLLLIVRV